MAVGFEIVSCGCPWMCAPAKDNYSNQYLCTVDLYLNIEWTCTFEVENKINKDS